MANFPKKPALSQGESPSLYSVEHPDISNSAPTDGGYEFRRRRYTGAPRKVYETGFIGLPHADFLIVEQFYEDHLTDTIFTWTDQIKGVDRQVRFDMFKPEYKGVGQHRRWDVKIKLSEV